MISIDVLNILPSKTEKKLHGEVMTPSSKINEALDMFDISDWSNPNLTWFGPSAGIGNFQVEIFKRLFEGLKEWEPNENLRLKHILENQIYVSEIQSKNIFLFLSIFDSENKFKLNFFKGDFLSVEFDHHMEKVWKIKKFDRCVENPPFQRRLDLKFLDKCIDICHKVCFIHPSNWLIDEKNTQKFSNDLKKKVSNKISKVQLFNGNGVFNIQLFTPCAICLFDRNYDSINIIDKINNVDIVYNDINDINKWSNIKEYKSLTSKIDRFLSKNKNLSDYYNKEIGGSYYINISRVRGHVNLRGESLYKDDFYTMVTRDLKIENKSNKSVFFNFQTEIEAVNFLDYIKLIIPRFCLSINKNASDIAKIDVKKIPYLNYMKSYKDDDLISMMEISIDEFNFIKKIIPDYYGILQ